MNLRRVGLVAVAIAVVMFAVTFFHLVTSPDIPSTCYGSDCLHGENRWVLALPGSIFLFMAGVFTAAFSGQGMGKTAGPASFDEVRAGHTTLPEDTPRRTRPVSRWTRTWRNALGYTALGELFLGSLFVVAGLKVHGEGSGGAYFTGGLLIALALVLGYVSWRVNGKDMLHETGLAGTARILRMTQTGIWMNNNPLVSLDMEVSLPNLPPYEVRHREVVPQVALGRLTQGDELQVRVNPHKPTDLIVLW